MFVRIRRHIDFTRLSRAKLLFAGASAVCALFAGLSLYAAESALTRAQASARAQALAALGRKLFFDPSLSGSRRISCASCHDPAFAYGPPNGQSVQQGGIDLHRPGIRAVPSLRYLQAVPQFAEHYFGSGDEGDDGVDNGPTGGLTWDGRVDRTRAQARIPLFSPNEMANKDEQSVVAAAMKAPYSAEIRKLSPDRATARALLTTILEALEAWQQDEKEFYPYNSKYDASLADATVLSEAEKRGLKLFTDPQKGNCAQCHTATRGANGTPPQFTDYGLIALGVPRNREIPANSDPNWFDLGLCGPERIDLRDKTRYCGRFMTPTLRNAATRSTFFHNGVVHTLKEAVAFYAQRDADPQKWFPKNDAGLVLKFNDLPAEYRGNVETSAPFGRKPGQSPALSDAEIDDIVAFLGTLTDGFHQSLP